jgi:hypothetical protein
MVKKYRISIPALELSRNEISLLNNPRALLYYRDKVDLNLETYLQS